MFIFSKGLFPLFIPLWAKYLILFNGARNVYGYSITVTVIWFAVGRSNVPFNNATLDSSFVSFHSRSESTGTAWAGVRRPFALSIPSNSSNLFFSARASAVDAFVCFLLTSTYAGGKAWLRYRLIFRPCLTKCAVFASPCRCSSCKYIHAQ